MKTETYTNVNITEYGNAAGIKPDVHYYRHDGERVISHWELTEDEALEIMINLIKLGGIEKYTVNPYNSAIHTYEVTFWGWI